MIFKRYFIALSVILMIVISGCGTETTETSTSSPYVGGTQGIVAKFEDFGLVEEGVPTIYEDENFPVEVILKNKGEEDIQANQVVVELKGISLQDFGGLSSPKRNTKIIDGVSEYIVEGGEETIDFGDGDYKLDIMGAFYQVDVFASFKYPYKTHVAVPKVCFSTDLRDTTICTVEGTKQSFSSAAPIKVTSVVEKRAGQDVISLEYTVENLGGGEVTKPGAEFDSRYGQVAFALDTGSEPSKWECKAGGQTNEARLIDGKALIRCKLLNPLPADTVYTKQIDLTISYDYRDIIQQAVRIKSLQ